MSETSNKREYDLEDRTFSFARDVRNFVKGLPQTVCNFEDVASYVMFRATLLLVFAMSSLSSSARSGDLNVLFLGSDGGHSPIERFPELAEPFAERGIKLRYTDRMEDLNLPYLRQFDALVVYANIDRIEASQEQALLEYVAAGG